MAKFSWSHIQTAEALEQSRSIRFQTEWRPILLNYFGLSPDMNVLEVGCGPGTLALYLAEGIAPGRIIGIDLDEVFIEIAKNKAKQAGISNVYFVVGDAYNLPFDDRSFDAVVSYTGIGVLADPELAVHEMLRVCQPGGSISIAEAVTNRFGIHFPGIDFVAEEELFPGSKRYHELMNRVHAVAVNTPIPGVGSKRWTVQSLFGLLGQLGVNKLRFNAWGYGSAPDDARVSLEQQQNFRLAEYKSQRRLLETLRDSSQESPGVSIEEFNELTALTDARFDWLRDHAAYDWEAGVSIVVSGINAVTG